jgi:hypothetical protein
MNGLLAILVSCMMSNLVPLNSDDRYEGFQALLDEIAAPMDDNASSEAELTAAILDDGLEEDAVISEGGQLTSRWTHLNHHEEQHRLWHSDARFRVVPAGRRSGKTEIAKRFVVKEALTCVRPSGRFVCAAPTHAQAKEIFWEDLKALVPSWAMSKDPLVSPIPTIHLINGARIQVIGMDKPARIEGSPVDGAVMDEYANMKSEAWDNHTRPALSTLGRLGWAWLIGVPEGRNHYYDKYLAAAELNDWDVFHWRSESVLPESEVEDARRELDPLTYEQEYGGSFVNFEGRAYYAFNSEIHVRPTVYEPEGTLCLAMDFNAKPGNCSAIQERDDVTQVLSEVFINRFSNTVEVVQQFAERYKDHRGEVHIYGDPSGNQHKSSNVRGNDWELVRQTLSPYFDTRVKWRVPRSPPRVRDSINSVNSRVASGKVVVDPSCKWMIKGLEGVERDEEGDLVKRSGEKLSHLTDGLRYYIHKRHPIGRVLGSTTSVL